MRKHFQLQSLAIVFLLTAILLSGCTTHKVDWNGRVGVYSYDQAILDMGPPDRVATLTDGTKVAEWLTYRGHETSTYWLYSPYYGYPVSESSLPDQFIRLTFTPEGKLKVWKKVAR